MPAVRVHEESVKLESSQLEITYENDRTKETLESRNSDLAEVENHADSSRTAITDIRSRYYKKIEANGAHSDYSYDMPKQKNKVSSPKKTKVPRNKSKYLNNTPKSINNSSSSKKLIVKKAVVSKIPNTAEIDYSDISQKKTPRKVTKSIAYGPNGHRVMSAKKRVASPKKQLISMQAQPSQLEKKLKSHISSTISVHQPTLRKSPRKSPKKQIRPTLNTKSLRESPIRHNAVNYIAESPERRRVSPMSSPKRKSPTKSNGRISPTKRMIDMKNSYIKNQTKAQKDPSNYGKLVYTISPTEAYIVDHEFNYEMENDDMAKRSSEL